MFEVLGWKKEDWDFVGKRRVAFAVSGILVAVGVIAVVQMARGRAALGIDFSGGLAVQASTPGRVDLDAVRGAFSAHGVRDAMIQQVDIAQGSRLLVRLPTAELSGTSGIGSGDQVVREILQAAAPGTTVTIEGVQAIGPAVGAQLQEKAAWAVLWSIVLIMIYIWVRFEVRFGVAAAIATAHDVVVVFGLMWLLHREFTLLIVTALLTLAGYSLTDTVVVFDRIRENLRLLGRNSFDEVINKSINEVLSRTLVTSVMVVLPLVALLVWGSPVTYDFALALTIGVVVGTYSSWFVASPILVEWEHWKRRRSALSAAQRFGQPK